MTDITDEMMNEALERIASTSDGALLYLYLQKVLCGVTTSLDPCALQSDHGRRKFAAELMNRMGKGIEIGGREHGNPVVFAKRDPTDVKRHVSAREYLAGQPTDVWPDRPGQDTKPGPN